MYGADIIREPILDVDIIFADITGTHSTYNNITGNELIPDPPDDWNIKGWFNYFEFTVDKTCRLSINDSDPIYFRQGKHILSQGKIWSVRIMDVNVSFSWVGKLARKRSRT